MGKLRKFSSDFADRWRRLTGRTPQVLARGADSKVGEIQKASGMSAKEIAQKVGVSERTVKAWQSGKREPRGKTAAKLNAVMTDTLTKRQQLREERAARQGRPPKPQPPAPRSVNINGSIKVGQDRTRPRQTHTVQVGDGNVTQKDIQRLIAARDSGIPGLVEAEAGRLIALAWGIPEEGSEYEVAFPGGVSVF